MINTEIIKLVDKPKDNLKEETNFIQKNSKIFWIIKSRKSISLESIVIKISKENWMDHMERISKMNITMKIMMILLNTIQITQIFLTEETYKKSRGSLFAMSPSDLTSAQNLRFSAIKYSMKEVIFRFTKELTQVKSHTHVISVPRCLPQLEIEMTTKEGTLRTNLTFAILLIIVEQNITENISL
jgi:hypothetical protein